MRRDCIGKFGELSDAPIDGPRERAVIHLKRVARVEHDHGLPVVVMASIQPTLQGFWLHPRRTAVKRSNGRMIHPNDFVFQFHKEATEGLRCTPALFAIDISKPRVLAQPGNEASQLRFGTGEEHVDPLGG